MQLANGLGLEIRDESRKLAGDRWLVCLRALVAVPLSKAPSGEIFGETLDLVRREIGETVYFQQRVTRNFISEKELPGLLESLKKTFLENFLPYLSHPDFAERFLKTKLLEIQEEGRYRQEYFQKILGSLKPPKENSI